MKLILGTAEFGMRPYGDGITAPPNRQEILKILNLAWESGIDTLDTADTYGTEAITDLFGGFKQIFKSRKVQGAYYHYAPGESRIEGVKQASVYDLEQVQGLDSVIVPLNINNTLFKDVKAPIVYVRSVFDRGKLLKEGYTVKDCLTFVKRHSPQGVIVGVNSVKELEDILKAWSA